MVIQWQDWLLQESLGYTEVSGVFEGFFSTDIFP